MSHELAYFLKMNVAIAVFYLFYRLFFHKDTFFQWRRTVLLCFLVVSLLYPLLNIQDWIKEQEPMVAIIELYSTVLLPEITIGATPGTDWGYLVIFSLNYVYAGILLLLFIRFLFQLSGIIKLGVQTPAILFKGTRIHLLDKPQGPFSFFNWIFIYPQAHTEEELEEILIHEKAHARQHHSVDIIFSELICMLCWFNPFAWLLKREIRNNLEFMADHNVLEAGHDSKTYQYHLLELTHQKKVATLYNSFNVLPLKIRIRMMNKKRTNRIGRTKYLFFFPLAALLLIVSNIEAIARSTEKIIDYAVKTESVTANAVQSTPLGTLPGSEDPSAPADSVVFTVVEQMPQFPGGTKALMDFLAANVSYPENAVKNNVQGRVIVQFTVSKEGDIISPKIVRSVNPELDNEAVRVITAMPKWNPGKQRGEDVSVKYTLPVTFKLPAKNTAK